MRTFEPTELWAFGEYLAEEGLEYKQKSFRLRAGGESHWYSDGRRPLSHAWASMMVGQMITTHAFLTGKTYTRVGSMGIGGIGPGGGASHVSRRDWVVGNERDEPNDQTFYPRGILGSSVAGEPVLVVDDTATTGDSIITLIDLVTEAGGIVNDVYAVVDRSSGLVEARLREAGRSFHSLYQFEEQHGRITPSM